MNTLKILIMTLFMVRIAIPFGFKRTYEAKSVELYSAHAYRIVLMNDKILFAPILFTIIEEKDEK